MKCRICGNDLVDFVTCGDIECLACIPCKAIIFDDIYFNMNEQDIKNIENRRENI